jgi:hypothetical protein
MMFDWFRRPSNRGSEIVGERDGTSAPSEKVEGMELQQFITETLVQIHAGVEDAIRQRLESAGSGVINPLFHEFFEGNISETNCQPVEFDVAVTVGTRGGAEAGIKVLAINIGGEMKREATTASRIRFTIPIIPPMQSVANSPATPQVFIFPQPSRR